jgi:DNA replication protein DnaC
MNITELAANLKLPYARDNWQELAAEARHTKQDYEAFLENLFDCEWRLRLNHGQTRRIKEAKFPIKKYLVDFKRWKYDEVFLPKFEELETLDFISKKHSCNQ